MSRNIWTFLGSAIARFWERGIEFSLNPMSFFSRLYERARLFLHLEEEVNVDDDRRSIVSWSFKFGPYDHADPVSVNQFQQFNKHWLFKSVCSLSSLAAVPMMWLALFLFGHSMFQVLMNLRNIVCWSQSSFGIEKRGLGSSYKMSEP